MPGTPAGARKRLTAKDLVALAPVFGFANDVDGFAQFVAEQQAKADASGCICEDNRAWKFWNSWDCVIHGPQTNAKVSSR